MIDVNIPTTDLDRLVGGLNSAQRDAVMAPPEHRLVLAGAGSGKTRVLTHRVAWLIAAEQVSPHSILAVTFTNKAASEMRTRIERLLALPTRSMWVGTFHGIAHRILRLHWQEASLPQNFQILDADDQLRLIKRVLRGLNLPEDRWPARSACAFVNASKEEGRRAKDLQDRGDFNHRQYVRIYTAYESACSAAGLVDFGELLLRVYELCRDNGDLRDHYRRRFRHILVDEFQDTNTLQYAWLRLLVGETGALFAVGDDDQSVYSWRGARIEHMMRAERDFPGAQISRLEQNYRSTAIILEAANGLIERNSGRLGKRLWTDGDRGDPIQLYAAFSETDEAEFVCDRIRHHRDQGGRCIDMAVLYRSNAQSRVLEEALVRHQLPYRIHGGLRFFERLEVKDALAYMRLLASRDDDIGFERAVNTPARGIGATTMERLRPLAREAGHSLWYTARAVVVGGGGALGRSTGAVRGFLEFVDALDEATKERSLADRMEAVIASAGLREHYRKEKTEQAETRLENLDELVSACQAFEVEYGRGVHFAEPGAGDEMNAMNPLTAFLAQAALEAGDQQADSGSDCVQLMTLHAAKGLEFPVVFLVGMENGLFPNGRAVNEGNLEEERRLCYVGLTRARQQLYLSHAETRRIHGSEQVGAPSPFLREIPSDCMTEVRPRVGILRPARGFSAKTSPRFREEAVDGYRLGQTVRHARFGEGTILAFDGAGSGARAEVHFRDAGTKWLLLSIAKLQPQ